MKILLKRISISLLLIASVSVAQADPRDERDARDRARSERQQSGMDRNEYPRGGYQGGHQGQPAPDQSRRQGRMSPEERQALRRQINEAGQDIYIKPR